LRSIIQIGENKMEKIFKIKWDDELGEGWMNLFNLELCLFSKECIRGKAE